MLNFLLKYKNIALYLMLIAALGWQTYRIQIYKVERDIANANLNTCTVENAQWKVANQQAQEEYKVMAKREALREQEAAKAQAESAKRMEQILAARIPGGCSGAIDYGIGQAQKLKFHWNNDIPRQ